MIEPVLTPADARRVAATLGRLAQADLREIAVTGGIAIAARLGEATGRPAVRVLNDLDVVAPGAEAFSPGLSERFLLAHLHPDALPGRLLVQAVDRANGLRVDVFGPFGGQLARSSPVPSLGGELRVASTGDLAARLASLLLDLGLGEPVPAKHARDFLALTACIGAAGASSAWADHRRPRQPETFEEARRAALDLIREQRGLLVEEPRFDMPASCPRCRPVAGLEVAAPGAVAVALDLR